MIKEGSSNMFELLALSDSHGMIKAVQALLSDVDKKYDAVVFAGDFTNAIFFPRTNNQEIFEETVEFLKRFGPVYYCLGNRDTNINPTLPNYLAPGAVFQVGGLKITSDKAKLDENTIYVAHYDPQVRLNALLHLEGHTHLGIRFGNYINLGFTFRDSSHGAEPIIGGYWNITITEDRQIESEHVHTKQIKRSQCKRHPHADYFNPYNKCPYCMFASENEDKKYEQIRNHLGLEIEFDIPTFSQEEVQSNALLRVQRLSATKLKEILKSNGIRGYSKFKKTDLVEYVFEQIEKEKLNGALESVESLERKARFQKGLSLELEQRSNIKIETRENELVGTIKWPPNPQGIQFEPTICKIKGYTSSNPSYGCSCTDASKHHHFCAHLWAILMFLINNGTIREEEWNGPPIP